MISGEARRQQAAVPGVSSNDNLAIFVLMLIASLGFGATAVLPREEASTQDELHGAVTH